MAAPTKKQLIAMKVAVWAVCLFPLAGLIWQGTHGGLTANPLEFVTNATGTWGLNFLLLSLTVTPLRKLTGQAWLIKFRRLIGLFAFFYIFLHFLTYIVFDREFDFAGVPLDVVKRPFITAGFVAFVILLALAATSTTWSIRKLGGKNWNRLHKMVYVAAIAGALHYIWKVKSDYTRPGIYAAILAVLLGYRVVVWLQARQTDRAVSP